MQAILSPFLYAPGIGCLFELFSFFLDITGSFFFFFTAFFLRSSCADLTRTSFHFYIPFLSGFVCRPIFLCWQTVFKIPSCLDFLIDASCRPDIDSLLANPTAGGYLFCHIFPLFSCRSRRPQAFLISSVFLGRCLFRCPSPSVTIVSFLNLLANFLRTFLSIGTLPLFPLQQGFSGLVGSCPPNAFRRHSADLLLS